MKSVVIIPTYNEIENISNIIHAVLAKKEDFHIIIVDYKSPDRTLGSFQSMFKVYQKKRVIYKKKSYKIKKIIQNGRSTFFSPALQK